MWSEWHNRLKDVPEDIRAEILLAELLSEGKVKESDFFFRPNGGFHRMVSDDVAAFHSPGATALPGNRAYVLLNRKGIYDGLPEGVFHQNRSSKPFRNISEVKEQITYQNKVEEKARNFFAPLDHELMMCRCDVEMNERSMTSDILDTGRKGGLKGFWEIPDLFSSSEQGRLMVLLPLATSLTASLESAAKAFHTVLGVPIVVERRSFVEKKKSNGSAALLGGGLLGIDTVTTGVSTVRGTETVVKVGPLNNSSAAYFAPAYPGRKKLNYLCDHFLPADLDVEIDVLVDTVDGAGQSRAERSEGQNENGQSC